jgi:hypothetical protein
MEFASVMLHSVKLKQVILTFDIVNTLNFRSANLKVSTCTKKHRETLINAGA